MNRPFLKWAGGKSQSLDMINEAIGYFTGRFIEPFVGSGVVFLNVEATSYIVNDLNSDLINLYSILKNDGEDFINLCEKYFSPEFNTEENFYKLRSMFNETSDGVLKATLFVYLNKHAFNGLCRYNSTGNFNTPFGKYKNVKLPKEEMKSFFKKAQLCEFYCEDFEETMRRASVSDIIYCDPPYVPLSSTANFTSYFSGNFSMEDQNRLAKIAEESSCRVFVSNHDTEYTRELYKNATKVLSKKVSRFISGKGKERKPVRELLAIYEK